MVKCGLSSINLWHRGLCVLCLYRYSIHQYELSEYQNLRLFLSLSGHLHTFQCKMCGHSCYWEINTGVKVEFYQNNQFLKAVTDLFLLLCGEGG